MTFRFVQGGRTQDRSTSAPPAGLARRPEKREHSSGESRIKIGCGKISTSDGEESNVPANLFSNPSTMPPTRGYTHVVETVSPSRTIYLSGQLGMMPDGKFAGAPDVGAAPPVLQEGEKSGRRPCTARTVSANR